MVCRKSPQGEVRVCLKAGATIPYRTAIYLHCFPWPHPASQMVKQGAHVVSELAEAPSRPALWTPWPAAALLCLSSKFSPAHCLGAVAGLSEAQQEPGALKFRKLLYRGETPATKALSSVSHCSPPLCQTPLSQDQRTLWGRNSDLGLWIVSVLNTVLGPKVLFVATLGD